MSGMPDAAHVASGRPSDPSRARRADHQPDPAHAALGAEGPSVERRRGSLLRSPIAWTAFFSLVAAWPIATFLVGDPFSAPPPRYELVPASGEETGGPVFRLPEFRLVDERGRPFGSSDLRGEVWVASFFFTSCPTLCPKLTARLVDLQSRLEATASATRMVTFTVDPETDTPPVLAAHAKKVGADPTRWTFVTGEPGLVEETIVQGFKQPMGAGDAASDEATAMRIAHGVRFVLVDRALGVRGLYDADDAGIDALVRDASKL